jgi:general secretion pathway protein G
MSRKSGFTLIELLMVIAVVAALAVLSITSISGNQDEGRYQTTLGELQEIRNALIGASPPPGGSSKSEFGYLGDVGGLPHDADGLAALWAIPGSLNSWSQDPEARIGSGWNGPYLRGQGILGTDYSKDGWGRDFLVHFDADPPYVQSLGADGKAGGSGLDSDLTLSLPSTLIFSTLHGLIQDKGANWSGDIEIEVNYPDRETGKLIQKSVKLSSGDQGAFQFDQVPQGIRSICLYLPSKAGALLTHGPFIERIHHPHSLVVYGTAANPLKLVP